MAEAGAELAPVGRMLYEQLRAELLKLLRSPIFSIFSVALPLIFYLFFGIPNANYTEQGIHAGTFLMASFGAYAVGNVMLSTFGITVAVDRGRRMDVLMRATPLRPAVFLASRVLAALCFAVIAVVVLGFFATLTGGVRLGAGQWLDLAWKLLVGSLPLIALGFAIGYLVSPNAAPAVVNLIALPLYFASGIFVPLNQLPDLIQRIAPYLPTYRYGQLAWGAVGAQAAPVRDDLLWLAAYTVVLLAIALRAYGLEESRRFG